jgi:hypothetical protein
MPTVMQHTPVATLSPTRTFPVRGLAETGGGGDGHANTGAELAEAARAEIAQHAQSRTSR